MPPVHGKYGRELHVPCPFASSLSLPGPLPWLPSASPSPGGPSCSPGVGCGFSWHLVAPNPAAASPRGIWLTSVLQPGTEAWEGRVGSAVWYSQRGRNRGILAVAPTPNPEETLWSHNPAPSLPMYERPPLTIKTKFPPLLASASFLPLLPTQGPPWPLLPGHRPVGLHPACWSCLRAVLAYAACLGPWLGLLRHLLCPSRRGWGISVPAGARG